MFPAELPNLETDQPRCSPCTGRGKKRFTLGIQTARSRTALGMYGFPISGGFTCATKAFKRTRDRVEGPCGAYCRGASKYITT